MTILFVTSKQIIKDPVLMFSIENYHILHPISFTEMSLETAQQIMVQQGHTFST